MNTEVWHIRPPDAVGPEVRALYGRPGFGGYMMFLRGDAIVRQTEEGAWELRPDKIAMKIHENVELIEASGYLMLDAEGPLSDPDTLPLYIEMAKVARNALRKEGLYDIKLGIFRIPDHARSHAENRFDFIPALRHTNAIFIMVKNSADWWDNYLADVVQVAPEHAHIWYLDAFSRRTGQPYSQKRILDTVRLAHRWLRNPQIGLRQEGPDVAQAIEWILAWLGNADATP